MCVPTLLVVGVRREWVPGGMDAVHDPVALDARTRELAAWAPRGGATIGFVLLPWADVAVISVPDRARVRAAREAILSAALSCSNAQGQAWLSLGLDRTVDALAWVERLPVRSGLASKPWRWRWSSAQWHCGFGRKPGLLAPEWTGPHWRALWRDRISHPDSDLAHDGAGAGISRSPVAQLVARHSPGMDTAPEGPAAMEPSQGELALA